MMTDEMTLIDVTGKAHPISKYDTGWILGAGWILFVVSFGFNCIFYKIHPSATDVSFDAIKRRLFSGEEGGWLNNQGSREIEENEEEDLRTEKQPWLQRLRSSICLCKKEQERVEVEENQNEENGPEKTTLEKFRSYLCFCKTVGKRVEENQDVESGAETTLSERLRKSFCFCKKRSQGKIYIKKY